MCIAFFWWITDEMYDKKLKEFKERQSAILTDMSIHSEADEEFYLIANTILNIAKRALEIFKSSEVPEKRQLLNFLLQNCQLEGKNLVFSMRSPFDKILATSNQPIGLPVLSEFRTINWKEIQKELGFSGILGLLQKPLAI